MSAITPNLEFIFTITDIVRYKRTLFAEDVAKVAPELTPGGARILVYAAHYGPVTQVTLARRASLDPMTISGFLASLEKGGYICRLPDQNDRRSKTVHMTDKGSDYVARIVACMQKTETDSRNTVTPEEWQSTLAVLEKIRLQMAETSSE